MINGEENFGKSMSLSVANNLVSQINRIIIFFIYLFIFFWNRGIR